MPRTITATRLPAEPLLAHCSNHDPNEQGIELGYGGRSPGRAIWRARAEGLHPYLADAWCTRLGVHGEQVWGDQWNDAWEALEETA